MAQLKMMPGEHPYTDVELGVLFDLVHDAAVGDPGEQDEPPVSGWPTDPEKQVHERMKAEVEERLKIVDELQKKDPTMPDIAALILAGDMLSAQKAQEMLDAGTPFAEVLPLVGSYAKLDFALRAVEAGKWERRLLIARLPDLWRGSDPDDTDPRFLKLWREARAVNGGTVCDGAALSRGIVTLYRGQLPDAPLGIAWTRDRKIAEKFALTLGRRAPVSGGAVLLRFARGKDALGYLTRRHESEVVIDPRKLRTA
jgi:hypothetical protein